MREEGHKVSIARLCRWFGVPRSSFYYRPQPAAAPPAMSADLVGMIRGVIEENPTYGLRRITAMVRRRAGAPVNRKRVHRIVKLNGWQVWQMSGASQISPVRAIEISPPLFQGLASSGRTRPALSLSLRR